MSEPLPLRKAIDRIHEGVIRIPGFQRKFVWEPERAALLMDSIYKGYPFGSVLLWRTRNKLEGEKQLGGFVLSDPQKDYPTDYVLDGQQRLTSIFATFQTQLSPLAEDPEVWLPIYYDFEAVADAQESHFVALAQGDAGAERYFPLRAFFDPVGFAQAVSSLTDERKVEIVTVQEKFKEALIPAETFENEDRASVAIVFERVNRMGVDLDIFELLTAWTWSNEFDLQDKFMELSEEFTSFGFDEVGSDNDLMLRCCAAILKGDPSPAALIDINGAEVRAEFDRVAQALRLAIDFLRSNLHIRHVRSLPYTAQLIPLAAFFSHSQSRPITDDQRSTLLRWFWRSSFGHRYSGNPGRNIKTDVDEALKLRQGADSALDAITANVDDSFFSRNTFNARTVATKTFILMLAGNHPLTFLSGQNVSLEEVLSEPNRKEFHHCAPKAWVAKGNAAGADRVGALANFAIISRTENRTIKDLAPSEYRKSMPVDITRISQAAFIPGSLWADEFDTFIAERAKLLAASALGLIG
ncbi:GmrSD restriction endonuclease domain-containing protein [Jiangella asiatica]|uniref:DUF262 domain-containing protein n=1 Tax=Jiangella asiatica TaxID=2530372 RepID=A0A4R5DLY4_9ACTN|nr:DUF262 domain-containing protein [Jiangella asiatica]TDE13050.1 DUF262 domain-containing protein [Jiangella asiatica]